MELRDYSELMKNAIDTVNFKESMHCKITGSGYVRETLTSEFVSKLYRIGEITKEDNRLLQSVFEKTEEEISRGDKVKIKNAFLKRVVPVIKNYIEQLDDIDLGLTPVDQVLEEIKSQKIPVHITGGPKEEKKEEKIKVVGIKHKPDITLEEVESQREIQKQQSKQDSQEYTQKSIITEQQKTLIRQLRTKLYNKDKIEIFPNQLLSNFIHGDKDLDLHRVDLVIVDKETYNIVCTVVIVDRVEIDFTATLLNKLNIKRFVVKHNNGVLDAQDIRALEEEINNRYAPMCKLCGLPMSQKENIKTRHRFYACMDNQKCRYTIDMGD